MLIPQTILAIVIRHRWPLIIVTKPPAESNSSVSVKDALAAAANSIVSHHAGKHDFAFNPPAAPNNG